MALNEKDIQHLREMDAEIKRLAAKIDGMNGPGVVNTPRAISIGPTNQRGRANVTQQGDGGVWMRIDDIQDDSPRERWVYTVTEVQWSSGWTWATVTNGRTGIAYNGIEVPNSTDSPAEYGNGVASGNLSGSFVLVAIGVGAIIRCWYLGYDSDQATDVYMFSAVNQVDGGCQ